MQVECGRVPGTRKFWYRILDGDNTYVFEVDHRLLQPEIDTLISDVGAGTAEHDISVDRESRVPEIVGIMTQGIPGGGAEKSTLNILAASPENSGLVVTASHQKALDDSVAHPFQVVPRNRVPGILSKAKVVVDDGAGLLGTEIPYSGSFIQTVRNSHPRMRGVLKTGHSPRVYTAVSLAEKYADLLSPDDQIIPNGVEIPLLSGQRNLQNAILSGRLVPRKGIAEVLAYGLTGEVEVIGEGVLKGELHDMYPNIRFSGFVDDVNSRYQEAGICLCYSTYDEGYWRVPFEAMANGCCLVTNLNGDLGHFLVPSGPALLVDSPAEAAQYLDILRETPEEVSRRGGMCRIAAQAIADELISRKRWEWILSKQTSSISSPPTIAVGLPYGGIGREEHLRNCLRSLARQTVPVCVYLLHDTTVVQPVDWVTKEFPWVVVVPVTYDRSKGSNRSKVRNMLYTISHEEIFIWLDSDCFVAKDFAERTAATLAVHPTATITFPRRCMERPEDLPSVLLEPIILASSKGTEAASSRATKDIPFILEKITSGRRKDIILAVLGPAQAVRRSHNILWDEEMWGWGGEEIDYGLKLIGLEGPVIIGPYVYHQEHEAEEADRRETNDKNMDRVLSLHGLRG